MKKTTVYFIGGSKGNTKGETDYDPPAPVLRFIKDEGPVTDPAYYLRAHDVDPVNFECDIYKLVTQRCDDATYFIYFHESVDSYAWFKTVLEHGLKHINGELSLEQINNEKN